MSSLKNAHEKLHVMLVNSLLKKIKSGEASAADLGVARQLLRDNGIDIASASRSKPLQELATKLPFSEEEPEAAEA